MNAWQIYWILQLDSIGHLLDFAAIVLIITVAMFAVVGGIMKCDERSKETSNYIGGMTLHRQLRWAVPLLIVFGLANTFVPSTKTMAAMIVLPAIVNNTKLQHEAGELYNLAKQALVHAVHKDDTPAPAKK